MKTYENDKIIIYWKPELCQHAGECVKGAPDTFNPEKRPWVNLAPAAGEDIAKVIDRCPSGALSYERKN